MASLLHECAGFDESALSPYSGRLDALLPFAPRFWTVVIISRVHIPMQQLTSVRIASERDIFRTLQYLPGILSSSQISSGLYIRGGSPDQNLILLDARQTHYRNVVLARQC